MTKKLPKDEVEVRVEFPKTIDKTIFLKLIIDLAKNLLLLKNQIPLQYDAIAKEVDSAEKQNDIDEEEELFEGIPSREYVRNRQIKARARRSKLQLVKNGRKLIEDLSEIEHVIREELVNDNVEKISFVFGATVHSAREVYSVSVPDTLSEDCQLSSSRIGLYLFRAMMSHDTLHHVTDARLPVSNMYFVLSRRSMLPSSSSLVLVPEFELPSLSRCSRVYFRFIFPETTATKLATRRLRFTSGADNPPSCDPLLRPPSETPSSCQKMVMCTPHTGQDRQRSRVTQVDNMVLSTPAPMLRHSHTSSVPSHSTANMDLCTPAISKIHSKLDIQTPACNKLPSSMEMCTPAVNHIPSSMELCTPANNNIQYSMEMCTPMVRSIIDNYKTENSGSMEMCTPETFKSMRKAKNCSQDSFQLQTPSIENLSLLSPNKKTKISHETEEQDLKDSGISSPDLSGRVENNKEIYWFLLESSIRGFKYKHY